MAKFKVENRRSRNGSTFVEIICPCGHSTKTTLWSWTEHGFKRCGNCRARLEYASGEAVMDGSTSYHKHSR